VKLTPEQKEIVDSINDGKSNILVVSAYSGAAKSSSVIAALNDSKCKMNNALIIAFNSKISKENKQKFPKWCDVRTIHSLGYKYVITPNGLDVKNSTQAQDFNGRYKASDRKNILYMFNKFCASASVDIKSFLKEEGCFSDKINMTYDAIKKLLQDSESGKIPCSHQVYIKLFQINLHFGDTIVDGYDMLFMDEFADVNECYYSIFCNIKATKKVAVGDCLAPSTRIKTDNGWMKVKAIYNSLKDGNKINAYSFNENTGKYEYKRMMNPTRKTYEKELIRVKTINNSVETTLDHRFLTVDGWKRAYDLSVNDLIVSTDGSQSILSLEKYRDDGIYVYDFEVEGTHNFVTSMNSQKANTASGLVLHNCNQSIYQFNHSIDGLQRLLNDYPGDSVALELSRSFRCSLEIAQSVNIFCRNYIDDDFAFDGSKVIDESIETFAFLTRTNASLIEEGILCHKENTKFNFARKPISILGPPIYIRSGVIKDYDEYISSGTFSHVKDENVETVREYSRYIDSTSESKRRGFISYMIKMNKENSDYQPDIARVARLAKQFSLKQMVGLLTYISEKKNVSDIYTLGTAFSTKGSTFDAVYLADDITESTINEIEEDESESIPSNNSEKYLAYVAATRARVILVNAEILDYCTDGKTQGTYYDTVNGSDMTYGSFKLLLSTKNKKTNRL